MGHTKSCSAFIYTASLLLPCSKLEAEGAVQHPWARVAHAAALSASGDADAAAAVLAAALQAFHVADKSEVRRLRVGLQAVSRLGR